MDCRATWQQTAQHPCAAMQAAARTRLSAPAAHPSCPAGARAHCPRRARRGPRGVHATRRRRPPRNPPARRPRHAARAAWVKGQSARFSKETRMETHRWRRCSGGITLAQRWQQLPLAQQAWHRFTAHPQRAPPHLVRKRLRALKQLRPREGAVQDHAQPRRQLGARGFEHDRVGKLVPVYSLHRVAAACSSLALCWAARGRSPVRRRLLTAGCASCAASGGGGGGVRLEAVACVVLVDQRPA